MSGPDHAENTGDNLRHAAEVQQEAQAEKTAEAPTEGDVPVSTPPDFNT